MSTEQQQDRKKPIRVDSLCYSGFTIEELEYIDFSRANAEPDDMPETYCPGKADDGAYYIDDDVADDNGVDVGEYEESANFSVDEFQSYLCSTPEKRREFFLDDLSGYPDLEYARNRNFSGHLDSGLQTQNVSMNSIVSIFGEASRNSIENLVCTSSPAKAPRRKIELDTDIHDPYSTVDELELSIEEEVSQIQYNPTTTLGTLRRRLSLKYFRRTTSTGLFGTYVQSTPDISRSQQVIASSQHAALVPKPTGPLNLWFRKFRNRHFI